MTIARMGGSGQTVYERLLAKAKTTRRVSPKS
jgi:hypothetical protein